MTDPIPKKLYRGGRAEASSPSTLSRMGSLSAVLRQHAPREVERAADEDAAGRHMARGRFDRRGGREIGRCGNAGRAARFGRILGAPAVGFARNGNGTEARGEWREVAEKRRGIVRRQHAEDDVEGTLAPESRLCRERGAARLVVTAIEPQLVRPGARDQRPAHEMLQ